MASTQEPTEQEAWGTLSPLPGGLNLLEGDGAGYCSGGVCHVPAPKNQAPKSQAPKNH